MGNDSTLNAMSTNFSKDRKIVREFFSKQARFYGDSVQSLAWESDYTQRMRFRAILEMVDASGQRILDVGCGKADLYGYMQEHDIEAEYSGVDMTRELISIGQQKFPEVKLFYRDFLEEKYYPEYDFTFSSGIANVKTPNNQHYMEMIIRKMFRMAKTGTVINMLSILAPKRFKDPEIFYYSPEKMLAFALTLTPHVILRHDYLPNDFTLCMFKKQ